MKSSPECCSPISVNFHFVHIDTWWLGKAKIWGSSDCVYWPIIEWNIDILPDNCALNCFISAMDLSSEFAPIKWIENVSFNFILHMNWIVSSDASCQCVSSRPGGISQSFPRDQFCWAVTLGFCHIQSQEATLETSSIILNQYLSKYN